MSDLLDELSHDLLSGVGPDAALRRLMRRGFPGRARGLDELRRLLRERRRRLLGRLNLAGPLAEIQERLNEILAEERASLAQRGDEDARGRERFLDDLPQHPAGTIRELTGYRFVSPAARAGFQELLERLQHQVLAAYFQGITGALRSLSPDEIARTREMLSSLNAMLAARERGEPHDFGGFMETYGDFFPENPRSLDELLEILARRMAAMSRLLASLSPGQRTQLEELARSVLADLDLAFQMDQLSAELRSLMPYLAWDDPQGGWGEGPMPLPATVSALERLSDLEELEEAVTGDYPGARLDDIDEEKLRRALGERAVGDLRTLKLIEKTLEEAGLLVRKRGRLEVSSLGAKRLGERALIKMFEHLARDRPGSHESPATGGQGEPTGATRPWRFGDTGEINVQRSIFNAVLRSASDARPERGAGVKLQAQDFELIEAESRTRCVTALLLDLSFSMPLRGHWVPAKRMALALHALIERKYPQDRLHLIGFSDYAQRLQPADLAASGPLERVYGTNMQHAFLLAGRLLAEDPRASRQVIMVTDGEPTAHLIDTGGGSGTEAFFSWPPVPETIQATLAEAVRLASAGVTLNVFMLEHSPGLVQFMEKLARLTGGRVFLASGKDLGSFILRDYVRRR
ncbi:MAG: vWA domain-containing protein [Actinomycetota bacterium]